MAMIIPTSQTKRLRWREMQWFPEMTQLVQDGTRIWTQVVWSSAAEPLNVGADSLQTGNEGKLWVQMKPPCAPRKPVQCHPWATVAGLAGGKRVEALDLYGVYWDSPDLRLGSWVWRGGWVGEGARCKGCPGPAAPVNKVSTSPELLTLLGSHRAPTWAAEEGSGSEGRK